MTEIVGTILQELHCNPFLRDEILEAYRFLTSTLSSWKTHKSQNPWITKSKSGGPHLASRHDQKYLPIAFWRLFETQWDSWGSWQQTLVTPLEQTTYNQCLLVVLHYSRRAQHYLLIEKQKYFLKIVFFEGHIMEISNTSPYLGSNTYCLSVHLLAFSIFLTASLALIEIHV